MFSSYKDPVEPYSNLIVGAFRVSDVWMPVVSTSLDLKISTFAAFLPALTDFMSQGLAFTTDATIIMCRRDGVCLFQYFLFHLLSDSSRTEYFRIIQSRRRLWDFPSFVSKCSEGGLLRVNQMDGDTLRIERSDGMLEDEGTMEIRGRLV